jgi:hypothetical protein
MSDVTSTPVVFTRPFILPGMDRLHSPGTFDVVVEREPLDVPFPAFRLTTRIMLSAGNAIEAWPVLQADLDAALAADRRPDRR